MSDKRFAPCLELPAGTRHVVFADLPHLIAVALWPEDDPPSERRDFAYGGARINLEEELAKAVAEGHLAVRDPLTLGLHTFPVGDALQHSVVLLDDLRAFLNKRGGGIEVRILPRDNASDLLPLGLIARDAAMRETPPVPGEDELRRDIRNAIRTTTEKDFSLRLSAYLAQGKLKAVNPLNGAPFDPELPHLDPSDPMWALDNAEHEKALEMLGQLKRTDLAGLVGTSVQSTAAHAAEAAAKDARRARGFYTLREAAQLLADAHDLNAQKLLQQLTAAFADGLLVVRDPETHAPLNSGRLRDFYDWVTTDDVNKLLADAWRVSYRLPEHGTSLARIEAGTPVANGGGTAHIVTLPGAPRARWTMALEQLLPQLEAHLKRAAKTREVARYLKENGASFYIGPEGKPDELFWTTEQGDKKLVTKKTLQNQISEFRNRKRPPG
jgi:hypothetical protein